MPIVAMSLSIDTHSWSLVYNKAGSVDIKDAHHTFPLLYYYLLPYIQEGKVLIRDEYKEFVRYSDYD